MMKRSNTTDDDDKSVGSTSSQDNLHSKDIHINMGADEPYDNHKRSKKPTLYIPADEFISNFSMKVHSIWAISRKYRRHILFLGIFIVLSYRANVQNHPYYQESTTFVESQMQHHLLQQEEYSKQHPDHREHPLALRHKQELSQFSSLTDNNQNLRKFMDIQLDSLDSPERDVDPNLSPPPQILIPEILEESLATLDEPLANGDIPIYFHVPRSGGTTMKQIMEICLNMKLFDSSPTSFSMIPEEVERNETSSNPEILTDRPVDIVSVQNPYNIHSFLQTNQLFTYKEDAPTKNPSRGRMFVMLRHPIDRISSSFYYYGKAHWEPNYDPELAHISLELYAKQNRTDHNYLTRILNNKMDPNDDITPEDFYTAKEILRTKCLIGLLTEKEHSFQRFEKYFQWDYSSDRTKKCHERLLHWDFAMKHPHPHIPEQSEGFQRIVQRNEYDLELYEYARMLFQEQANLFHYHTEGHVIERKGHF